MERWGAAWRGFAGPPFFFSPRLHGPQFAGIGIVGIGTVWFGFCKICVTRATVRFRLPRHFNRGDGLSPVAWFSTVVLAFPTFPSNMAFAVVILVDSRVASSRSILLAHASMPALPVTTPTPILSRLTLMSSLHSEMVVTITCFSCNACLIQNWVDATERRLAATIPVLFRQIPNANLINSWRLASRSPHTATAVLIWYFGRLFRLFSRNCAGAPKRTPGQFHGLYQFFATSNPTCWIVCPTALAAVPRMISES